MSFINAGKALLSGPEDEKIHYSYLIIKQEGYQFMLFFPSKDLTNSDSIVEFTVFKMTATEAKLDRLFLGKDGGSSAHLPLKRQT